MTDIRKLINGVDSALAGKPRIGASAVNVGLPPGTPRPGVAVSQLRLNSGSARGGAFKPPLPPSGRAQWIPPVRHKRLRHKDDTHYGSPGFFREAGLRKHAVSNDCLSLPPIFSCVCVVRCGGVKNKRGARAIALRIIKKNSPTQPPRIFPRPKKDPTLQELG